MQKIYTDGGASPNPGTGGWAAVLVVDGKKQDECFGMEEATSNNRMELTAAIQGLSMVPAGEAVTLVTDSNYLKLGITQWIHGWKANGWRTANKKPVKNQDLWMELDAVVSNHTITWSWVKGHDGDQWNEYADLLVHKARGEHDY